MDTSFRVIDKQLRPRLLRYFMIHHFSQGDAEDLVQTTLAKVFQGVGSLEHEENFMAWLFAIARNAMFTASEKMRRMGQMVPLGVTDDPDDPPVSQDVQTVEDERIESIWKAVEQLPAQQRLCLILRVRDGLSYEEIAATLRLSLNTVRNHLTHAKASLRRVLRTEPEESL